jgi:predicted outer membrane repeat protein
MLVKKKSNFFNKLVTFFVVLSLSGQSVAFAQTPQQQDELRIGYNDATGKVSFIGADPSTPIAIHSAQVQGLTADTSARAMISPYAADFGLKNLNNELQLISADQVEGRTVTRFQQIYKGIPIMGGEMIVNATGQAELLSLSGEISPDLTLDTNPTISPKQAQMTALEAMAKSYQIAGEAFEATEPELWIYDSRLFEPDGMKATLVWRMEIKSTDNSIPVNELVLVDAKRGQIVLNFNQIDTTWHSRQEDESTVTPTPTEIPTENATEIPTEEPVATETPLPSETPIPTETPVPSETPSPTEEIQPTPTSETLPSEEPEEIDALAITTYYVNGTTGNDSNTCTSVAAPCQHIQQAIEKGSTAGDIIKVASGTYTWSDSALYPAWKNVVIMNRSLTLSGGWNTTFLAQDGISIIDGANTNNGILATSAGTAVVGHFIIQNSVSGSDGAGIYIYNTSFTLQDSTVKNNIAGGKGSGVYFHSGTLTVTNSTISGNGNSGTDYGSGIYANSGAVTITNTTIAYNTAVYGGGISHNTGIYTIKNTIIANNTGTTSGPDCSGAIGTSSYNIIGNITGCTVTAGSGDQFNVDPQLNSPLTGTMQIHTLQPTSPAIDAGTTTGCPTKDQRGIARSICDIGAYEYLGNHLVINTGGGQTASANQAFSTQLSVKVLDDFNNAVSGITVTFTAPSSGPGGVFSGSGTNITTAVSGADGVATAPTLTANASNGGFIVAASATQYSPINFTLMVGTGTDRFVATTGIDENNNCQVAAQPCKTIQRAVSQAATNNTIYIAQGTYGTISISSKSLTLLGGWDSTFTNQNGVSVIDGSNTNAGVGIYTGATGPITIDHFVIQNGSSSNGAGITIHTDGSVLISNTTIKGNTASSYGGGIYVSNGNVTLRNSTVANNKASSSGGGISLAQSTSATIAIENSTIVYNSALWGGGLHLSGPINIKNSIIANNEALYNDTNTDGPDCGFGSISTSNYNIIGNTSGCTFPTGAGNQYNVDPLVSEYPLGAFAVYPLSSNSPAMDAGNPATCTSNDQRGAPRLDDGLCDIGAYEHATPGAAAFYGIASGNNQTIGPRLSPAIPLSIYVIDSAGTPVEDVSVTFTAPTTGPSGVFTSTGTNTITVNTNSNGLATISSFVANLQLGTYNILVSASGLSGSLSITLTNKALFVSPTGSDSGNCLAPAQSCQTINYAISKATSGDSILVATGTYTNAFSATRGVGINKDLNLFGGWNNDFTAQTGMSIIDGENARTGMYIVTASASIDHFIVQNGYDQNYGGGIYSSTKNLIITNSLVRNNTSSGGGGGVYSTGNVTILNSTIANNTAYSGAGIYSDCDGGCVIILANSTIAYNKARTQGGGIWSYEYDTTFTKVRLLNSILEGNTVTAIDYPPYSQNCWKVEVADHSIISNTAGCTIQTNSNSLLNVSSQISDYTIGAQNYFALLPGSPAIDSGNPSSCLATDVRGVTRPVGSACDIGPYEYKTPGSPTSLLISNGNVQRFATNSESPTPFVVNVVDGFGSPVSGVNVTFTAPVSGVSGKFASTGTNTATVTTNSAGLAQAPAFTTNPLPGTFNITATSAGFSPISFVVTSVGWYVSPDGSDSAACDSPSAPCLTMEAALSKAQAGDTIYVRIGTYTKDSGDQVVDINKSASFSGGWNSDFTLQDGFSTIDGENARRGINQYGGANASIYNFIIENGAATSYYAHDGGGIDAAGLSLFNSIVRNNHASENGGGISGSVKLYKTLIENNVAGVSGGGVYGDVTSDNATIKNNSAVFGGGIYIVYEGSNITNTLITKNSASLEGGGIYINRHAGIINNTTITENTAPEHSGVAADFTTPNTLDITNSILANNTGNNDCYGKVRSYSNSLIEYSQCESLTAGEPIITRVDPKLSIHTFGFPGYIPLMSGSPAINTGKPATCATKDQRGLSRPQQGICDIGAYEYAVPGPIYSTNLLGGYSSYGSMPGYTLLRPISVSVLDVNGSPVTNSNITLTAPLSGPSGLFTNNSNTITVTPNIYGVASAPAFLPNAQLGQYSITASPGTVLAALNITNGILYVDSANGSDVSGNTCTNLSQPCKTINTALNRAIPGQGIRVAAGKYNETILISKDIIITGGWDSTFTSKSGQTILDGNKLHQVISIGIDTFAMIENVTIANGYASQGAGIYNRGNLTLVNSAVVNNTTFNDGGGIYQARGSLVVKNTTISNNSAKSSGGGVYIYDGNASFNNVTITQNLAQEVTETPALGGGLSNSFNKPVTVRNSIIAGNIAREMPDCRGNFTSRGNNLIGYLDGCILSAAPGDLTGTSGLPLNAKLGNLADNGGGTPTHALLNGSPAINTGNPASCETQDQRGIARPEGSTCDMGAFEGSVSQSIHGVVRTYTSQNSSILPGTLLCDQTSLNCTGGSNLDADKAHQFALSVYQFYASKHNRQGIDSNNMPIISSVKYCSTTYCPYKNAFWDGAQMVYGNGYSLADDVVAHELTHGVTQYESNLFYYYQSGAINESFSDVWGELYDQQNKLGNDAANVKWLHGEDLPGGAGRSMSNPPLYGDPDKMTSAKYFTGSDDNGGVHHNSGINNKAAYLMVSGGAFNGKTITAIGADKTLAIYYEVQTNLLTSGADYADLYNALYQGCLNLVGGALGITANNCQQVRTATTAVEMNLQPDPDFNTDAPLCNTGLIPNYALQDNLESGTSNWTIVNGGVTRWQYGSPYGTYAHSGTKFLYADDYPAAVTNAYVKLKPITIPPNGYLHFSHVFDFEKYSNDPNYYDGGVLEYSTNGGAAWVDAGSLIEINGYKGKIFSNYNNPLKGRSAFVGTSHGYISTRLNLSSLSGKSVTFRWRMGLDGGGSRWGWWLDDVQVYRCVTDIPVVVSSMRVNPSPTSLASVSFTVKFSEAVTGVDAADFSLTITGIKGARVTAVSGSGAIRKVTVNTGSGNGTLRLNVIDNDTILDADGKKLGGTGLRNGNYIAGQSYTIVDKTAPKVVSSVRVNPSTTNLASVKFTVTFSEVVTGVDAADFSLTATGIKGAKVTAVSGTGATRTLTISTGTGNGTLRLNVIDNDTILDEVRNKLGGTGLRNGNYMTGQSYTIRKP